MYLKIHFINILTIYSCGPLHMDEKSLGNQQEPNYNSSALILYMEDLGEAGTNS